MSTLFYFALIVNISVYIGLILYGVGIFRLCANLSDSLKFSSKLVIILIIISVLYYIGIKVDIFLTLSKTNDSSIPSVYDLVILVFDFLKIFVYYVMFYYLKVFINDKEISQYEIHQLMQTLRTVKQYIDILEKERKQ